MFYSKLCTTYYATIHMAGQAEYAKLLIQKWVLKGACVQVQDATYIYTGGREEGFTARFINYPRFPRSENEIYNDAINLGKHLATELGQISFTIETPSGTVMYSTKEDKFETN